MANPGADWSNAELEEIVGDYLAMLSAEVAGEAYSKADHRRDLLRRLENRTLQAVEFKHANISAVMIELGLPYIRGYKPRGNYQAALETEIRRRIGGIRLLEALRAASARTPARQHLERTEPPAPPPRRRGGRQIDYGALHEENRRRGAIGEQLVVAFEQETLRQAGSLDLASRVRWAARDDGDGLGYDVMSFSPDGRERYIEVKATAFGPQTPFYMSSAELEFALSHTGSFALYRVYDVLARPRFYVVEGEITHAVDLVPATYRAQVKSRTAGQLSKELGTTPTVGANAPPPSPEEQGRLLADLAVGRGGPCT